MLSIRDKSTALVLGNQLLILCSRTLAITEIKSEEQNLNFFSPSRDSQQNQEKTRGHPLDKRTLTNVLLRQLQVSQSKTDPTFPNWSRASSASVHPPNIYT